MRKNITVVGLGARRHGTSRSGNNYDFQPVHVTFPDDNVKGLRCAELNVDGKDYDAFPLELGFAYDAVLHEQNFRLVLDAVLEQAYN